MIKLEPLPLYEQLRCHADVEAVGTMSLAQVAKWCDRAVELMDAAAVKLELVERESE